MQVRTMPFGTHVTFHPRHPLRARYGITGGTVVTPPKGSLALYPPDTLWVRVRLPDGTICDSTVTDNDLDPDLLLLDDIPISALVSE